MTNDDKALVERLRQLSGNTGKMTWVDDKPMTASNALAKSADRIEAISAENERLREANRFLRRGLYGLMDSDDADSIATTIEAGGIVDWDKYPPSARAALGEQQ